MKTLTSVLSGLAAFAVGFAGAMRALSRQEDVEWTDDGTCTCSDTQLLGHADCPDRRPSGRPLSPLLETLERELWVQ